MNRSLRLTSLSLPLLGLAMAACQDATLPAREAPKAGPNTTAAGYYPDPWWEEPAPCDPYDANEWLSFCDQSQGSGGGGGGGDGSGSGDAPQGDEVADQALPDCTQAQPTHASPHGFMNFDNVYCRSTDSRDWAREHIEVALQRIRDRGGICAEIADQGEYMLNAGRIRTYTTQTTNGVMDAGGYANKGDGVVLLSDSWILRYTYAHTGETPPRNLDHAIVHELDHMVGLAHLADVRETPNSRHCSGV
jgi:hypothetical protein